MTLTAQDIAETHRAGAGRSERAPAGSELKLQGTVHGAAFKVKFERNRVGRLEADIDGIPFADDRQVQALPAAFKRPELKELDLKGRVGHRPVRVNPGAKGIEKRDR